MILATARQWWAWAAAFVVTSGATLPAAAQETLLYAPYVRAVKSDDALPDGTTRGTLWASGLTLFNNSNADATYRYVAGYGRGAAIGCPPGVITVAPGSAADLGNCFASSPSNGVGISVFGTTGSIVPHATVSWVVEHCRCQSFGCTVIPQGRVPVPVFTGLFAAGSTVVHGEVDLGNPFLSANCATLNQRYPRRVNVALFNAGDAPATFRISVRVGVLNTNTYFSTTATVAAKDVVQINSLPLTLDDVAQQPFANGDGTTRLWVLVTADQPYLSWVSSVFDSPEPGAMPMEVFPPHLQN